VAYKNIEDQREGWKRHYRQNRDQYLKRNKDRKEESRQFLQDYKTGKSCMDCGETYPHYVLDFDHRDPSDKKKCVSQMLSYSLKTIIKEIEKCDLVCANCHRIRTHSRG
jgi:NAD-dependent dihydropyrimidine dehydrogenase PreA subunit